MYYGIYSLYRFAQYFLNFFECHQIDKLHTDLTTRVTKYPPKLSLVVVVLGFYVSPTAKVIRRRDLSLKSHPKD